MKNLVFVILFLSQVALAQAVKSKEEIIVRSPESFKLSTVGKIPEFRGIIDRVYPQASDLRVVDLYQFKSDAVKVSQDLCMKYVEKIFGLKNSKLFALKSFTIEKSNKGNVCEAFITDTNTVKEDPYLRYVVLGFVNAQANALVFHPDAPLNDAKIAEIRKFWENLR